MPRCLTRFGLAALPGFLSPHRVSTDRRGLAAAAPVPLGGLGLPAGPQPAPRRARSWSPFSPCAPLPAGACPLSPGPLSARPAPAPGSQHRPGPGPCAVPRCRGGVRRRDRRRCRGSPARGEAASSRSLGCWRLPRRAGPREGRKHLHPLCFRTSAATAQPIPGCSRKMVGRVTFFFERSLVFCFLLKKKKKLKVFCVKTFCWSKT